MGKRELLIGLGFVIIGLLAFALTSTPSTGRRSPPRPGSLVDRLREETTGSPARAVIETTGIVAVGSETRELDLSTFTRVDVRGEARSDVAWTLRAEASGADDDTARRVASGVRLVQDDRGATLALSGQSPGEARRLTTTLTLVVPARMRLTVSDARGARINGLGAVALEGVTGDFEISAIAGAVTGAHRNGALKLDGTGDVRLSLVGGQATFRGTRGEVAVTCRNGACAFEDASGPLTIDSANSTIAITRAAGDVRVTAANGQVAIEAPSGSVNVEARRAQVTLTMTTAVAATVVSSDGKVVLALAAELPITLDAIAARGSMDATSVGLTPQVDLGTATLRHVFGTASRVSLRNDRGEIVITRRY